MPPSGIRTHNPSSLATADLRLRQRGQLGSAIIIAKKMKSLCVFGRAALCACVCVCVSSNLFSFNCSLCKPLGGSVVGNRSVKLQRLGEDSACHDLRRVSVVVPIHPVPLNDNIIHSAQSPFIFKWQYQSQCPITLYLLMAISVTLPNHPVSFNCNISHVAQSPSIFKWQYQLQCPIILYL